MNRKCNVYVLLYSYWYSRLVLNQKFCNRQCIWLLTIIFLQEHLLSYCVLYRGFHCTIWPTLFLANYATWSDTSYQGSGWHANLPPSLHSAEVWWIAYPSKRMVYLGYLVLTYLPVSALGCQMVCNSIAIKMY